MTGTDTDAGKTVAAALLVHALKADYWKPIQSGTTPATDRETLHNWLNLPPERYHKEGVLLQMPASPHAAAAAEGVVLQPETMPVPTSERPIIIEGAGGLMVPLRDDYLLIDLFEQWKFPVVLVVNTVLGCINHSLLSVEALKNRGIPILGIVFNEGGRPESEEVILAWSGLPLLGKIPRMEHLGPDAFQQVFDENFNWPWQP